MVNKDEYITAAWFNSIFQNFIFSIIQQNKLLKLISVDPSLIVESGPMCLLYRRWSCVYFIYRHLPKYRHRCLWSLRRQKASAAC